MSGSNDGLMQAYLLQMRNQQRRPSAQSRLAEQMMASLNNPAPIYGTGPAIARIGSGVLAGLMGGMAERSDREREDQQLQAVQDRQDKRELLQTDAYNVAMGRPSALPPVPQMAPQQPMPMDNAAPSGAVPYGRNAGMVAQRDALLEAPPEQLAAASAARSGATGIPEIPGGYRANPGLEGVFNGAPRPTGVVNANLGGNGLTAPSSTPTAEMLRQRIQALSALGDNPRAIRQIQSDERDLARLEQERIRREDRAFVLANRPPVQAPAPLVLSPGQMAFDRNGRPIATAPERPPVSYSILTPEQAATAGLPPAPEGRPYQRNSQTGQISMIGGSGVTVNNSGENSFDRKSGDLMAEEEAGIRGGETAAAQTLARLQTIERNLGNFTTGALSGARLTAGQIAAQLGASDDVLGRLGIGRDQVASGEQIRSMSSAIMQGLIGPGGFPAANFSNADREMLERSLPSLSNSPTGNQALISIMRAQAERQRDLSQSWAAYRERNGRSMTTFDRWQREERPRIIANDVLRPLIEGFTTGQAQPGGGAQIGMTGQTAEPPGQSAPRIPTVSTAEEMARLPPGATFQAPDGSIRRVPAR